MYSEIIDQGAQEEVEENESFMVEDSFLKRLKDVRFTLSAFANTMDSEYAESLKREEQELVQKIVL